MKIRLADKSDLKKLAKIFKKAYDHFDVGERWDEISAVKYMEFWFKKQPDLFFVAEENEKIVGGFVSEIMPWWNGNHLYEGEIFVDPDNQRRGVGTNLIKEMMIKAKKEYDVVEWNVTTYTRHDHPLSWYEKMGFEKESEWMNITGIVNEVLEKIK